MSQKRDSVDFLRESYDKYIDIMENPSRLGYMVLLAKLKNNDTKVPLNIDLLDELKTFDRDIRQIANRMLKKVRLFNLPDGIK